MLVKEEICAWFKELSAAKRIDLMCGLLHMCLPLEKRFLGLFLEDLCRADYTSLRAEENKSNSINEVKKLSNDIKDPLNRSRIILTLCLMYSTNSACSQIMFDLLTSIHQMLQTCNKNEFNRAFVDDIVTLFTMGIYHPAFTFSQKYDLYDLLQMVESYVSSVTNQSQDSEDNSLTANKSNSKSSTSACVQSGKSGSQSMPVHVQDIELIKGSQWQTTEKKPLFKVHVFWSDGTKDEIFKTYQDFFIFHAELIKLFPKDSGAHKQERHIPFLPQEKGHTLEEMQETMRKYVRHLTSVPDYILQCDHMTHFFSQNKHPATSHQVSTTSRTTSHSHKKNQTSPACFKEREKVHGTGQNSPAHIKSQIIYNSHLDVELTKKMAKHDSPSCQKSPKSPLIPVHSNNNLPPSATRSVQQQTSLFQSPLSSPLASPLSSPYISPASSQYEGSRPNSPTSFSISGWLKQVRLHKYSDRFKKYSLQEFIHLKDEELEKEGLTKGAQKRFRTEMDAMKANLKPGINGTVVLEIPLSRSPMPSRYGNHSNQGYSSSSSSCSSASSSSCSQIPNKALFPHPQHLLGRGVGLGSREDSPSLSDESSSPADSPQPSDNHSPRVDIENGMSESKGKLNYHFAKLNINGDIHELNGQIGPPGSLMNGPHMTLHNMAGAIVRPIMTYAMPPQGMLMHRPHQFYRSPRSPVIRPDGTPGFMPPPRLRNGLVSIHPQMAAPVNLQQPPPPPVSVSEVISTTNSTSTSSVSCQSSCNSQGTMTSPVFGAPGAYPLTAVVSSGSSSIMPGPVTRPSTLNVQQQLQQLPTPSGIQSPIIQTTSCLSAATAVPPSIETNSSNLIDGNPVPGVITLTPDINVSVFQTNSSNNSISVTSTTVSYSLASAIRNAVVMTSSSSASTCSIGAIPVPTSVVDPGLSGQTYTGPPPPGNNISATHSRNGGTNSPQMITVAPPTTVPTPLQQTQPTQPHPHPSASDSPGSDCSQCTSSNVQQQPPQQPNTLHSYSIPQLWPPPQHPHHPHLLSSYMSLTPGSNGLVTHPPSQAPNYIPSYIAPPNGFSQELFLQHNSQHMLNLMTQALAQHPHQHPQQQQQMLACAAHMQQNYHGGYVQHSHSGDRGGGKGKTYSCYNCGQAGHKAYECVEPTMEAITNPGTYHLNMRPKDNSE